MPPSEHLLPHVHQIRDRVPPIADELVQLRRNERDGFSPIQAETTRQAALGERAQREEHELVLSSALRSSLTHLFPGKDPHVGSMLGKDKRSKRDG